MDVRCPKCQTLYELDDTQVKATIVTLKCSQCQYVFRFESKQVAIQENHRRWMIRKRRTGDILYCNTFDVLHQWIMQGQVAKVDEISRTGNRWVVLGDIGEFVPVFQVVESISSLTGQSNEDSSITPERPQRNSEEYAVQESVLPTPQQPHRKRVQTEMQFGRTIDPGDENTQRARPSRPTPSVLPPSPRVRGDERSVTPQPFASQWEIGDEIPHTQRTNEATMQTELPRSSRGIYIVLVLFIAAGGYLYFFQRSLVDQLLGKSPTTPVSLNTETTQRAPKTATQTADSAVSMEAIDKAIAAAFVAKNGAEASIFGDVMAALRPAIDSALGVATEEAELAAEGGGLKWRLEEARKALERGRTAQALSMYKDVLDIEPRNSAAITGVGWCYIEMGRFDDAANHFKRAFDIDPHQGDALIGLGTAERQRGNLKAAYDAYDLYLGRYPKGPKSSIARYQIEALKKQLGM